MPRLNIYDRRERVLVGAADRALTALRTFRRLAGGRRSRSAAPRRILLLRLERIGDLVMALPAIADVRAAAPDAQLDLVVGSWNAALAGAIEGIGHVETLDARWLARGGGSGLAAMLRAGRRWRERRYDLAINFEPDVRSNLLAATCGAAWTAGFASGGGGPLLDVALDYDPRAHTTDNTRRLVSIVFDRPVPAGATLPPLAVPDDARRRASSYVEAGAGPLVGIHASGGRAIKQWEPERFAEVARRLVEERDATIVLTGEAADRALVDCVKAHTPRDRVMDAAGDLDLLTLAALLERLDLFVTGDTGPMHLAWAVGTPIVSVFGPSDPARYAPRGIHDRVVRVDLPCSPCNRIRLPPGRCVGHTPDCLSRLPADAVSEAALAVLDAVRPRPLTIRNARA